MDEFFGLRYDLYRDRKDYMLKKMKKDYELYKNKSMFIEGITNGTVIIQNKKRAETLNLLRQKGFKT